MVRPQFILDLHGELIIDNFAGGGGASTGIELALGRCADIAINHDPQAIAMHEANHPQTLHLREDVFKVDPVTVCQGRPVGLAWFSPDCTHFSKAKGGKPRSKKIRGLAWVAVKWAAKVQPRVIVLENVEEFKTWGPLLATGYPCPHRKGRTFRNFVRRLENLGYQVEWRELRACDFGAPTIRKRLFLIARRDGRPIVWPEARTDWNPRSKKLGAKLKQYRTAAECIDWSLPCPSIFDSAHEIWVKHRLRAKRPLAPATERRIARGLKKFVLSNPKPFIVRAGAQAVAPYLTEHANASTQRNFSAGEPLRTQCAGVKGGHFALVTAFLAKHFSGDQVHAAPLDAPAPTVTARDHNSLVAAHLTKFYGTTTGQRLADPLHTVTSGAAGGHHALVQAFLMKYYSEGGQDQSLHDPMHTLTTNDRMALVKVDGQAYRIEDIGMRMLKARELFRAQGFPDDYIIDPLWNGKPLCEDAQVRMCGNSVPPQFAAALAHANVPELAAWFRKERAA